MPAKGCSAASRDLLKRSRGSLASVPKCRRFSLAQVESQTNSSLMRHEHGACRALRGRRYMDNASLGARVTSERALLLAAAENEIDGSH